MTNTTRAAIVTIALSLANTGCAVDPAQHIERFQGTWTGTNAYGMRVESRIERVDEDAGIIGTGCWSVGSGLIRGARLDNQAKMSPTGKAITAEFGTSSFTAVSGPGNKLVLHESRSGSDGKTHTIKTTLEATTNPQCANRFLATAAEITPAPASDSIVGHWTGTWGNGNTAELAVDAIDDAKRATGRMCWRDVQTDAISILDLYEGGPLSRNYDPESRALTIERQATSTRRHRQRFIQIGGETVRFESTNDVGSARAKTSTLTMRRGVHPEGCLRHITSHLR